MSVPEPDKTRRLARFGRAWRNLEDSLETSVTPWLILSAVAAVGWIVSYLIWGDVPLGN